MYDLFRTLPWVESALCVWPWVSTEEMFGQVWLHLSGVMVNSVSTWLGPSVQIFGQTSFCMFLWESFWVWFTFRWRTLKAGWISHTHILEISQLKALEEKITFPTRENLPADYLWTSTSTLSWVPSLLVFCIRIGLYQLHNCVSKFLNSVSIYTHILLVVSLEDYPNTVCVDTKAVPLKRTYNLSVVYISGFYAPLKSLWFFACLCTYL